MEEPTGLASSLVTRLDKKLDVSRHERDSHSHVTSVRQDGVFVSPLSLDTDN